MSTDIPFEAPWGWHRHGHPGWPGRKRSERPADSRDDLDEARDVSRRGRAYQEGDQPRGGSQAGGRGRGRSRGRRHSREFGAFGAGFGPGFGHPFGPGGWGPRGGRARRGDVRAAILSLLAEEPMHGYQLIQEIARRSDGVWRPSAGSVYPALAQLEDEGLVRPQVAPDDEGGKKVFVLTEAGQAYVAEHADELADPWDAVTGGVSDSMADLMGLIREVHAAAVQVLRTGDPARVERARATLAQTRRSLYLVLAGDEPTESTGASD
jgi:DNA-binding PadR family transcriptional regulator